MTKAVRIVQSYLLYSLPFVLVCMIWGSISKEKEILQDATFFTKASWELLSWNLILWFAVLILFLAALVSNSSAREQTLKRIANIKDQDEREAQITGQASKASYISTLSVLIFLLFLSVLNLDIRHVPKEQAINGKTGTISIGLSFKLFDTAEVVQKTDESSDQKVFFESKNIPLSKSAIILLIIIWQVASFNLSARKELNA